MSDDSIYYIINEGEFTANKIDEFNAKREHAFESWKSFTEKYNAENMYIDNCLRGLEFDKENVPDGWISKRGMPKNIFKPARRKVCMNAYHEFRDLPSMPSGIDLANMLGISPVFTGRSLRTPGFEELGDIRILSLAEGSSVPEGVTELKASEYWKMKEEADEK